MRHILATGQVSADRLCRQEFAGPRNGTESCTIAHMSAPAGYSDRPRTSRSDSFFYVLDGAIGVRIEDETFVAGPHTMVFVPAGGNYTIATEGHNSARYLDIRIPSDTAMAKGARRSPAPPAGGYLRPLRQEAFTALIPGMSHGPIDGFGLQALASRDTGSARANINVAEVQSDAGGPRLHVHPFDQFYYVLSGALDIQIGLTRYSAPTGSLVVLPAGTVHANWNNGPDVELHLVIMTPSLLPGKRGSFPVSIAHTENA